MIGIGLRMIKRMIKIDSDAKYFEKYINIKDTISFDKKYLLSIHPKYDKENKYWKRHFFDLSLVGGYSFTKYTTGSSSDQV